MDRTYYLIGDIMFKNIFVIIKKIVLAVLFIYAYNKFALPLNLIIPINVVTVGLVASCGIPSLFMLILYSLVCI